MATTPGVQRLFVAVYPPPEAARRLLELLEQLSLPPHTPAPAEQVHMTLQFIGDTARQRLAEVTESVQRSTAGLSAFFLKPVAIRTLPRKGSPRLVAIETDAPPALLEIHRRLVHRLARNPREESVKEFLPHLTLLRFKPGATCRGITAPANLAPFEIAEVRLMRSRLKPGGAVHETVAAFALAS